MRVCQNRHILYMGMLLISNYIKQNQSACLYQVVGQIVPHTAAQMERIPEIMEVVYHPAVVLIDQVNTSWGIGVVIIDHEGYRSPLLITINPEVFNLKLLERNEVAWVA